MRALLLSDIHANLEALDAVLNDASAHGGFDAIWCLGDTVGYGPDPGECIGRLRDFDLLAVAGNHDYAAVGKIDYNDFNGAAQESTIWTAEQLTGDEAEFLSALPLVAQMDRFTLVHGSLVDPLVEYLLDGYSANATLALLQTPLCLVGHSHLPFICRENDGAPRFVDFTEGAVTRWGEERWIINPGSVGQPRDRDPRPSYGILDSAAGTLERRRVEYDIGLTQAKMRRAGLPEYLVDRLSYGC